MHIRPQIGWIQFGKYDSVNLVKLHSTDWWSRKYPSSNPEQLLPRFNEAERKKLLRSHGVELDSLEAEILDAIRSSRSTSFCKCGPSGVCNSDTCVCFQDGVKCHIEGPDTCACSERCCVNPIGRFRFDSSRVRMKRRAQLNHFHYDYLQLLREIEDRKKEEEDNFY